MKKLGKLNLKSEKILNQEELVHFKGGSGGSDCPGGECDTTNGTCSTCKQAVPFDCEYLGGYTPGTYGFNDCVCEGYTGCCQLAC